MKELLLGTILGGLIAFFWGAFSWMVLSWHDQTLFAFSDEDKVAQVLLEQAGEDGVYVLPNFHQHKEGAGPKEAEAQMHQRMRKGPFAFVSVRRGGTDPDMKEEMGFGLANQFLAAFLIILLLKKTSGLSYWGRVGFVVLLAATASVLCHLPYYNWWGFPAHYTLIYVLELIIGWFLSGLVIAKVVACR